MTRSPLALLLLLPSLANSPAQEGDRPDPAPPLVFSAMGCGPYNAADAAAAEFYIAEENRDKRSQFLVHLGDICTGSAAREGKLTEDTYSGMKRLFTEGSTIPAYFVPGDNEWNDRPDPDVGWSLWRKHLLALERDFAPSWETERQKVREENFAFVTSGVLVIGINLPGGRVHDEAEWRRRFGENNDWISAQFDKRGDAVGAAVVCCQANIVGMGKIEGEVNKRFAPFRERFAKTAARFAKPVLLLHADGHKWLIDQPLAGAPNVTRLQVDRLEPRFPPAQITVDPHAERPFQFDRRLEVERWKVPAGE